MRSPRAIMAGIGTSGSLLAAVACVLALASALIAFHGWPSGKGLDGRTGAVRVDDRAHPDHPLLARAGQSAKPAVRARGGRGPRARAARPQRPAATRAATRAARASLVRSGAGHRASSPVAAPRRSAGGSTGSTTPPSSQAPGVHVALPAPISTVTNGVTQTTGHVGSTIGRTAGGLGGTVGTVSPGAGSTITHSGAQVGGTVSGVGQSAGGLLPGR